MEAASNPIRPGFRSVRSLVDPAASAPRRRGSGLTAPLRSLIAHVLPRRTEPAPMPKAWLRGAAANDPSAFIPIAVRDRCTRTPARFGFENPALNRRVAAQRPLRVLHVVDADAPATCLGRMVISGRMADVCAELDRLAASETRLDA